MKLCAVRRKLLTAINKNPLGGDSMPTDKRIVCFRAAIYLVLLLMCASPSFAATTITDWGTAQADYPGSTAGAVNDAAGGIVWSRHNLSAYGWPLQAVKVFGLSEYPFVGVSAATTEICVFCHTPHFGKTDTAPLWNRGTSATGYVPYGTTVGGTAITSVGGSSLACLSCHDGVTTFDNLINKPGKGSNTNGTGTDQGWRFYMATAVDIPVTLEHFATTGCGTCHSQEESDRLNIGLGPTGGAVSPGAVDLSNDHPINVAYNGGTVASLRDSATVISSLTMDNARSNPSDPGDTYGRSDNLWAVKGFISDTATISDLLRDSGKVQCTSCHDPHYKNQTNNDPTVINSYTRTGGATEYNYTVSGQYDKVIDGLFLRRVGGNSNSGVCRTCHNK